MYDVICLKSLKLKCLFRLPSFLARIQTKFAGCRPVSGQGCLVRPSKHLMGLHRLVFVILFLWLQGCAMHQKQMNQLVGNLENKDTQQVLLQLEKIQPKTRDRAQYLLNRGMLKSLAGDISGSNQDWQEAKQIIESLLAVSVTENLSSVSVNETYRSYTGSPSERVLLHLLLVQNYLRQEDLDGARVEVLQASVTMQALQDGGDPRELASMHFVSGMVYEINREYDNALISYRRAFQSLNASQQRIPEALQISLLKLSAQPGFEEEHEGYLERFDRALLEQASLTGKADVFVLYFDGTVSQKYSNNLSMYAPGAQQVVSLALPAYPRQTKPIYHLHIEGRDVNYRTQSLEGIDSLLRQDLKQEMPALTATALARATVKYQSVKAAHNENDMAGALMNVFTLLSETADIRSWNTLPASLQVARLALEPDDLAALHFEGSRSELLPNLVSFNPQQFVAITSSLVSKPTSITIPEVEPEAEIKDKAQDMLEDVLDEHTLSDAEESVETP